jgi:predicted CXXCH cytochrome family protein
MNKLFLATLLLLLTTSCARAPLNPSLMSPPYASPHVACGACHGTDKPKGASARFAAGRDPSRLCLACHKYAVNHHPTDFAPSRPVSAAYPLFQGRVTCLSCHEMHGGPEQKGTPRLLRGGPFQDRRKVCYDCHTKDQYAGLNPHLMLDEAGNQRTVNGKPVCLQCHEVEPDPSIDQANTVLFKADVGFLCWRCHPLMHSETMNRHFLKVPSQQVRANMERPEVTVGYALPLVPRGRITCSTCHNPHQEGVLMSGPAAAGSSAVHRLRSETICQGCHNR